MGDGQPLLLPRVADIQMVPLSEIHLHQPPRSLVENMQQPSDKLTSEPHQNRINASVPAPPVPFPSVVLTHERPNLEEIRGPSGESIDEDLAAKREFVKEVRSLIIVAC